MSTRHTCHVECFPLTSLLSRASYERGQAVSGCSRTGPLRWASLPAPAALENASAAVVLGFGAVLVCDKTCGLQFKPPPPNQLWVEKVGLQLHTINIHRSAALNVSGTSL